MSRWRNRANRTIRGLRRSGARGAQRQHTSGVDPPDQPADHSLMPLDRSLRRLASAGLAVLVLVSSLTCMTVACKVVCAAEAGSMATAAATDLPPCHGAAKGGSSTAPAGGCTSGSACCSTWLHDRDVYRMPAPILVRASLADDVPALLSHATSVPGAAEAFVLLAGADPPEPCVPPLPSPRASRAPPAA